MPVTTKTGDRGFTSVKNGRVSKDEPVIDALGNIDECSSLIIHMQAQLGLEKEPWELIVKELYEISAYIAGYTVKIDVEPGIKRLETFIELNQSSYSNFIYPFDQPKAAFLHYVRTVVRRAERSLVKLNETQLIETAVLQYMNRLSDYCFVNELV